MHLWPNLRYYTGTCLEGITKNHEVCQDSLSGVRFEQGISKKWRSDNHSATTFRIVINEAFLLKSSN
jgi:hypothetical protein